MPARSKAWATRLGFVNVVTRDVYLKQIQPALAQRSEVANSRGARRERTVLRGYLGRRIPQSEHWQALAKLVGVSQGVSN
jgi:hypothetical protein